VEEDPSFHEAVHPLKRLETAFTENHYYLHMIAFQNEGMGGRRSIKQTNTSLVSATNLQTVLGMSNISFWHVGGLTITDRSR